MKKYYVRVCNPEWFKYEDFYDEDAANDDKFEIIKNSDFAAFGWDGYRTVARALEYCSYDLDVSEYNYDSLDDMMDDQLDTVRGYFRNELTTSQLWKLYEIIGEYNECASGDEIGLALKALEIVHGVKFITGTMRGNSASDWFDYICPESLKPRLDWIEAVLMATGTELCITVEPVEEGTDLESVDCYYDYTDKYRVEDIKAFVADSQGTTPENVIVIEEE